MISEKRKSIRVCEMSAHRKPPILVSSSEDSGSDSEETVEYEGSQPDTSDSDLEPTDSDSESIPSPSESSESSSGSDGEDLTMDKSDQSHLRILTVSKRTVQVLRPSPVRRVRDLSASPSIASRDRTRSQTSATRLKKTNQMKRKFSFLEDDEDDDDDDDKEDEDEDINHEEVSSKTRKSSLIMVNRVLS